jgi:CheY-like chemotaxis protein
MDLRHYNVLYVDDEKTSLRVFSNTFKREFSVFTASSGAEGLELLENVDID